MTWQEALFWRLCATAPSTEKWALKVRVYGSNPSQPMQYTLQKPNLGHCRCLLRWKSHKKNTLLSHFSCNFPLDFNQASIQAPMWRKLGKGVLPNQPGSGEMVRGRHRECLHYVLLEQKGLMCHKEMGQWVLCAVLWGLDGQVVDGVCHHEAFR